MMGSVACVHYAKNSPWDQPSVAAFSVFTSENKEFGDQIVLFS